ncbi:MAG: FixH family protein [Bacteroidia bacterium]
MKFNWGHKLVFFGVCFMLFVMGMVFYMTQKKNELVDENYYEKGIRFQEELNKFNATEGKDIDFTYATATAEIQFKIPTPSTAVKVQLYRPSDSKLDQNMEVTTDADGKAMLSTSAMAKGLWQVKLEWAANNSIVTFEKAITVQ